MHKSKNFRTFALSNKESIKEMSNIISKDSYLSCSGECNCDIIKEWDETLKEMITFKDCKKFKDDNRTRHTR